MLPVLASLVMGAVPTVVIDGQTLPAGAATVVRNKTYVALRPVADALSAQVQYDGRSRQVTFTTVLRQVIMHVGDAAASINGARLKLDAPPLQIGGRVALPLRALGAALGARVRYDRGARQVVLFTRETVTPANGVPTPPPVAAANTLEGTVTRVSSERSPPAVEIATADGTPYILAVPEQTAISFRDVHGGVSGRGSTSQIRPGDTLLATMDASGRLIAVVDIFAGFSGTIAAVSGASMVLANGKVVIGDRGATAVTLNGRSASFDDLKAGDIVSVRAEPRSGRVRDIVALTPGINTGAKAASAGDQLRIDGIRDDAQHALRAGQTLHISLSGTSGGDAWFDLGNVIVGNPMREVLPGHYEGVYVVRPGTNIIAAPVLVRLTKNGATVQSQASDPLNIITTPPVVKDAAPDNGARINNSRPNVYVSFSTTGDQGMDASSLHMTVNGKDVSADAARTSQFISYFSPSAMNPGRVNVEVRGMDSAGNRVSYKWSFVMGR